MGGNTSKQIYIKDIGLPSLQERRIFNRLSFFYKVANGLVPARRNEKHLVQSDNKRRIKPKQFSGYISKNPVWQRCRNNSKCFDHIDSKCAQYKYSFFPRTIVDWNTLDNSISCISKVLEKCVHDQVQKYLISNDLIYEYQSGFRPGYSTESCLVYLTDYIKENIAKGYYVGALLLDVQKAFDCVNHEILCEK